MEKQFCSYEIALKLKELGFDEECLAYYAPEYKIIGDNMPELVTYTVLNAFSQDFYDPIEGRRYSEVDTDSFCDYLFAPLWQQVIDWFRIEKNINIEICYLPNISKYGIIVSNMDYMPKIHSKIENLENGNQVTFNYANFIFYEEAREQAILKAIEIVKDNILKQNVQ